MIFAILGGHPCQSLLGLKSVKFLQNKTDQSISGIVFVDWALHLFFIYLASIGNPIKRKRESQYWPGDVCLDFLQQRLCPRAAITLKEPHNTHKQRVTHKEIVSCILPEMRAKQTTEGGNRDWLCVGPWGPVESERQHDSIEGVAHKGVGFTKTNRARVHSTAHQLKTQQTTRRSCVGVFIPCL